MCIRTHNNKHNCYNGTRYKNDYDYLKRHYCGSTNFSIISNYVKTILRTQSLETNISSLNSSISQALMTDSPNSASYQSAKSSKSSASYQSAKSRSSKGGKRKTRR